MWQKRPNRLLLCRRHKLRHGQPRLPNQAPEGSFRDFCVVWDRQRRRLAVFDKDDVAALLSRHFLAESLESFHDIGTPQDWESGHRATTST